MGFPKVNLMCFLFANLFLQTDGKVIKKIYLEFFYSITIFHVYPGAVKNALGITYKRMYNNLISKVLLFLIHFI